MEDTKQLLKDNEPTEQLRLKYCEMCGGIMMKKPINTIYLIENEGLYVLYTPKGFTRRKVSKTVPGRMLWFCNDCPYCEPNFNSDGQIV